MDNDAQRPGELVRPALPAPRRTHPCDAGRPTVSVILVDDAPELRMLLGLTFDFHGSLDVRGEATDGVEAVRLWREQRPDVVVMDVRMPLMSGGEAAGRILAEDPAQLVVLFSAAFRHEDYELADAVGVTRCFDKRDMDRLPELVYALGTRVRQV